MKCTHPDHIDGQSCEEHAVGCNEECECCCPKILQNWVTVQFSFPLPIEEGEDPIPETTDKVKELFDPGMAKNEVEYGHFDVIKCERICQETDEVVGVKYYKSDFSCQ